MIPVVIVIASHVMVVVVISVVIVVVVVISVVIVVAVVISVVIATLVLKKALTETTDAIIAILTDLNLQRKQMMLCVNKSPDFAIKRTKKCDNFRCILKSGDFGKLRAIVSLAMRKT